MTTQPKQYKLLKDLPFAEAGTIFEKSTDTPWNAGNLSDAQDEILCSIENNPDWFKLVVETPKSMLKYDNGAVVEKLKDRKIYFFNDIPLSVESEWHDSRIDFERLFAHNVFLTKEEAEKALLQQQTYNHLYKKIREIDEQNGFVCDWENTAQEKWYVYWTYDQKFLGSAPSQFECQTQGTTYMSEQSANYLCRDAVTKVDQKLFCGILD